MSGELLVGMAALLTAAVNSGILIYATFRASKRDQAIAEVHSLVNGLSDKRDRASRKAGRIQGADKERAHPTKKK